MGRCWQSVAAVVISTVIGLLALTSLAAAQQRSGAVPVLVYHRFGPVAANEMTVTTAVFAAQLEWLHTHHYQVIPLRRLTESLQDRSISLPPHAVVITADDGHLSVYTDMLPLIRRYQVPVTLFVYPSAISNADYAMTWGQLAEMVQTGLVDVQSHTYWHPNFHTEARRLSPGAYQAFAMTQFARSRDAIAHRLGTPVNILAWPFGIHDESLEQWAAKAGYVAAFTLERADVRWDSRLLALPRFLITDRDRGARFAEIIQSADNPGARP